MGQYIGNGWGNELDISLGAEEEEEAQILATGKKNKCVYSIEKDSWLVGFVYIAVCSIDGDLTDH